MEKLNCESLMIGDWILDGHVYAQVTSIACDGIIETTHNESSNTELVEPIPITSEILEKNRFKSRKDGYDIGIPLLYWDKYCNAVCGWTHCDDIIEIFDCRYVHELQHALKLCRIEKEIVL